MKKSKLQLNVISFSDSIAFKRSLFYLISAMFILLPIEVFASHNLYLDLSKFTSWKDASAHFAVWVWSGDEAGKVYNASASSQANQYVAELDASYKNFKWLRLDPNVTVTDGSTSYPSVWNGTKDLEYKYGDVTYITGWGDGDCYQGCSVTQEEFDEEEYMEFLECDSRNTQNIFWEKFTFSSIPDGDNSRSSYYVSNSKYSASIPSYSAVTKSCGAVKNEGSYAMLINSKNAGCYQHGHGHEDCNCVNAGSERWFRDKTGHTVELDNTINASYDGMLLFNCNDGTGCVPDVMYECIVNDICPNTFINFSAYVTAANTGTNGNIPIEAEFRLFNADDDAKPLAIRKIKDVTLESDWKKIYAMFNSGSATRVKIQLVNKAASGQGNDMLLDDVRFDICTPKATLKTSNGLTSITLTTGQPETLTAELVSGVMTNPFYLWQYKNDIQDWTPVLNVNGEPASGINKVTATVVPERPNTEYRVIVAPTSDDAYKVARNQGNTIPCGMYAETNTASIVVKPIEVKILPETTPICKNSRGGFVISVTNNTGKAIDDVKLRLIPPTDMRTAVSYSPFDATNYVWEITSLPTGTSKFYYYALAAGVGQLPAQAHISAIGNASFPTYDDTRLPNESRSYTTIDVKNLTFSLQPKNVTSACEDSEVSFSAKVDTESAASCKGTVKYQWVRRTKGTQGDFSAISGAINSTYVIEELTAADAGYEYAVIANIDGCPCKNVKSDVVTIGYSAKTTKPDNHKYMECQTPGEQIMSELFDNTKYDPSKLTFYTTPTGSETITEFDKNDPGQTNYYFTYKDGNCESDRATFNVQVLATPEAEITSDDEQKICTSDNTQSFAVSATFANGSGKWEVKEVKDEKGKILSNSVVTIADVTKTETTATLPKGTVATLTWKVTSPGEKCFKTAETILTAYEKPVVIFDNNSGIQAKCATSSFTVSVKEHPGSGSWEIVGEANGASYSPTTGYTTNVTGLKSGKSVTLRYTAKNGECVNVTNDATLTNQICDNLSIQDISSSPSEICKNGVVTLAFEIKNNSTVKSTSILAKVELTSGLTYSKTIPNTVNYDPATGIWDVGDLEVGATANLQIQVNASEVGDQTATVTITSASGNTQNISNKTSVTVYGLPTASFVAANSEICASSTANKTAIKVNLSGASPFTLSYTKDNKWQEKDEITTLPYVIEDIYTTSGSHKYKLVSVKDENGCSSAITGQEHIVTVDAYPTLGGIESVKDICDNGTLALPKKPEINLNGSTQISEGWILGGKSIDANTKLPADEYNGKLLQYAVTAKCASTETTQYTATEILVTVDKNPSDAVILLDKKQQCNDNVFNVTAEPIQIGTGVWTVSPSATITDADKSGATITVDQSTYDKEYVAKYEVSNGACPSKTDEITLIYNNCTSFTLTPQGIGPKVCDNTEATFNFELINKATVEVKDVTIKLTLDNGLTLNRATAGGIRFVDNQCVIPSMAKGDKINIEVKATATTNNEKVYIEVIKSSDKDVTDVKAEQAVTVWDLPTAEFAATSSEICASTNDKTSINVNLTGATPFRLLVYTKDDAKQEAEGIATSTYTIEDAYTTFGSHTYQLTSVTDANGCKSEVTGQKHKVTVDEDAKLGDIDTIDPRCEGSKLMLPNVPSKTANNSTITGGVWKIGDKEVSANTLMDYDAHDGKQLYYSVQSTCGNNRAKEIHSNKVDVEVDRKPTQANAGVDITQCNDDSFELAANTPDASKSETGKWTISEGNAYFSEVTSPTSIASGVAMVSSTTLPTTLTWTISSEYGVCTPTTDDVKLTNNNCTNFDLKGVEVEGTDLVVCYGTDATFTFTLKNNGAAVENVTLELELGSGLEYKSSIVARTLTFDSNNQCVVPTMDENEEISITVVAKATVDKAAATVKLTKSSNVTITGVTATQNVEVNELPALKFESPTSTICIDGTLNASDKQQTSAKVLFTAGEPTYKFSYSIGNKNYDDIEVTGTSHIIAHDIDADANITISKVVDTHGCVTRYNDVIHKVETQKHATLSPITAPETVCETDILALTAPTVTNNGARVDGEKWVLDNSDFDPATPMDYDIHNNKDLFYQINSYCNDIQRVVPSNKVKVTVYDQPEETSAGEDQAECGVSEFYLDAEEPSAGSGKWIVASDSSEEWLKDVKFEDDTDPKTKVYGIPEGKSVTLMWTVSNGTCTPMSDLVQITNNMIPVLSEEITSVNSLDKDSIGYKETIELTCFNDKLYLIPSIKDAEGNDYPTDKLDFSWSKQDGNSFEAIGEGKTEIVREEGTYKLQVKDKATGCTSGVSYITIEDKKITPVIKNITSYTMSETGEATDVESNIINCYNPVLIIKPSLDNTDNIKYEWSTGSVNDSIHVIRGGDYSLKVQNTVSGCYAEEVKYSITENKRTPIIEDIISVNSTDETVEGYLETQIINCKDTELFISSVIKDNIDEEYSPEELKYDWTVSYDDGEIFEAYGEAPTISTTSKAIFRLVVTDKVTGCPAVADTIEIKENIVKPVISYIESYETINPTGTGIKEEDVLTCKKPVIYLRPTIEESTDVSYKWSDDSTEDYLKVEEQGTYGLVVEDNTSFCSSDEVTFSVTENKRTPIIEDIISVNSTDETVEGYKETQIINCKDTELFISSVIKDKVETQYSPEELEYDWTVSYDNGEIFEEYGEAATITATEEAIFRLVVTDNLTGCPAEAKTIEITEVKTTPTIKSMTSVSTIDPEAEKVEETNVLTCEYPVLYLKPTIESENEVSYKWNDESTLDYLKVEEKGTYTLIVKDETTFCSSEVYSYDVSENKNAPVLDIQSVYELCPSDTLSAKTLSSLLPNVAGVTYKFYDESGEEIADVYEVSSESSVNSYYVIGTSANGCSSEKASFDVDFAKNVDFTLTASQTSMMIGGNETVVTITPDADSDIATSYIWTANDEEIDVDGLEFVDNLYIDTNFKVTASNRCDSDTKEAFIEVLWPTAFTPHNGNGKNDTFAKGMKLIVFNRFYTKIFEGEDGWDGTINGAMNSSSQTAVPGVYFYSVQLPNGQVKKGTIEIVKID